MNYAAAQHNPHNDDADYIAALGFRFRSAKTIRATMAAAGITVSLDAIRAKMTEFVTETALVEAKGNSWRIVPSPLPQMVEATPMTPANDVGTVIPTTTTPLLVKGDGLALMRGLPDRSVDLVLCDLPYGTTGLAIDPRIDVQAWMDEMARIVTERGAIVAFSAQPFTTDLMIASRKFDKGKQTFFKQEVIWEKVQATGFPHVRARRLKAHENILIFSHGSAIGRRAKCPMTFNPQGVVEKTKKTQSKNRFVAFLPNAVRGHEPGTEYVALENCPRTVLFGRKDADAKSLHSFAKPLWLLDDLIRTYSNEGDLVLDPTMGSGSTIVAALNTGRRSIGAENGTDRKGRCIFTIAKERIATTMPKAAV